MLATLAAKHKVAALFMIVALGLFLRLRGLDRVGFNEDEVNKVEAARAYLRGDFSVNLEHPMLMKSLVTLSLAAADFWNRGPGQSHQVPDEVAVRLPNVIFGSLTAVVIFLFAQEFFGVEVGLLSALVWSIGTIAIMGNRLAKEDTLLVFFTWLAYYLYLRAKKAASADIRQSEKFYAASGASFGLMLAAKYFPHYLGLNFLYYYLFGDKEKYPPRRWRDTVLVFGTCALVFVLANPVIFLPDTLKYMVHYAGEGTMTHHGYLMMGRLYFNDAGRLRGGMPIYFYPLFLVIKTPLPILGALMIGLVETWKRRREPGPFFLIFMFLFWVIPFSLLGSKWLRYMLSWMPIVSIIAAVGLVKIFSWSSALVSSRMNRRLASGLVAAVALVFLALPAWVMVKSAPYYSLYLNPLGLGRTGYYFPHDEVNDMGLREAIKQICEKAPEGTSVGGEAEPVFAYYFHQFGRDDLHYFDLSDQVKRVEAPPSAYLVVQDGRKYFENMAFIQKVEAYQTPIQTFDIGGAPAARVYRDEAFAELRMAR
jgi:4-amino-4-deoxy-L-arabinose transferase-like glycosyltransferase